jgi:hypothetical protein
MNRSLADVAHDIISTAKANDGKIKELRELVKNKKSKIHDQVDNLLLHKMCIDLDGVMKEFDAIYSRVLRSEYELQCISDIISSLPNVKDQWPGRAPGHETTIDTRSTASPC